MWASSRENRGKREESVCVGGGGARRTASIEVEVHGELRKGREALQTGRAWEDGGKGRREGHSD